MNHTERYRLSRYKDYGALQDKEHVRLVRNEQTGRIFIKKIVDKEQKAIYRFLKEHPDSHWPGIEEYVEFENKLVIVEEYVEGRDLQTLTEEKCLNEYQCAGIICELCKALQILHGADAPIICRDLKAENILVTTDGNVKIVDFDIARTYQPGKNRDTVLMGTAGYAAPEQFGYFQTDNRTDIYALGVLLNYMLVGKFPYEKISHGRFERIIEKCTALNPAERYQSVEEMKREVSEMAGIEEEFVYHERQTFRKKMRKYMPPGFRSGTIWKMFLAVIGYVSLLSFVKKLNLETESVPDTPPFLYVERVLFFVSQMLEILVVCNYMGVREKLPIVNNGRRSVRVAGYILYECIFTVASLVLMVALQAWF